MVKTQILHVAVDKPTEKQLRWMAKEQDLPLSAILRSAIKAYLAGSKEQSQNVQVAGV
jgi:hypothetical protein